MVSSIYSDIIEQIIADDKDGNCIEIINRGILDGSINMVIGRSGCGKSTTGRTILRLIEKTDGQVLFNGKDVYGLSNKDLL